MNDNHSRLFGSGLSLSTVGVIVWIVFISLKCAGVWDLSWFWVWFPLWIGFAIDGAFLLLVLVIYAIAAFLF